MCNTGTNLGIWRRIYAHWEACMRSKCNTGTNLGIWGRIYAHWEACMRSKLLHKKEFRYLGADLCTLRGACMRSKCNTGTNLGIWGRIYAHWEACMRSKCNTELWYPFSLCFSAEKTTGRLYRLGWSQVLPIKR